MLGFALLYLLHPCSRPGGRGDDLQLNLMVFPTGRGVSFSVWERCLLLPNPQNTKSAFVQ